MIVIAGGTGRLGTQVATRLAARGLPVRVPTRDRTRARPVSDLGVEVVRCDVRNRADVESALEDATTVVSAVHGFAGPGRVSPESVDRDGDAAERIILRLTPATSSTHRDRTWTRG